mmetsp:Transcript_39861/g.70103  ORF Transcript_39861/g.70103 Transcript_39861/m.70103 type:complete len:330 (-) Transcript_39861:25-1014(-)
MTLATSEAMSEQQFDLAERFKYKEGCWFDWLVDERHCAEQGCDLTEWQLKEVCDALDASFTPEHREKAGAFADVCKPNGRLALKGPRVVWCHEHCHKAHNDARRRDLWRLCHEHGSSIVCVKKAAKLAASSVSSTQAGCILITDWREAKPCMDIDFTQKGSKLLLMIVFCENEQVFSKASKWAANLPLTDVRICPARSFDEVAELLVDSLQRPGAHPSEPRLPATRTGKPSASATPSTQSCADSEYQFTEVSAETCSVSGVEIQRQAAFEFSASAAEFSPSASEHSVWAPAADVAQHSVMHVLGPVFSTYSTQQLSQALEEAMPDYYYD